MENGKAHKSLGTVFVIGAVFYLGLVACGKNESSPPAPSPCRNGVNLNSCGVELSGKSRWVSVQVQRIPGDAFLGLDPDQTVERRVVVIKDFEKMSGSSESASVGTWKRSLTLQDRVVPADPVEQKAALDRAGEAQRVRLEPILIPRTMTIEGRIHSVTQESLDVSIDRSSCDGIDRGFAITPASPRTLYYVRNGDGLSLSLNKPLKFQSSGEGGLTGFFADIMIRLPIEAIAKATGEAFSKMIVAVFTLGRYRDDLASGEGNYSRPDFKQLVEDQFTFGQIGCFAGSGATSRFIIR